MVLGVLAAPAQVVEPLIALSVAYVGIENLLLRELKPWRLALVFGFGLVHGMGFANAMQELPVPDGQMLAPLVGFNLGVELGQLAVLAGAFALTFWMLPKEKLWSRVRFVGIVGDRLDRLVLDRDEVGGHVAEWVRPSVVQRWKPDRRDGKGEALAERPERRSRFATSRTRFRNLLDSAR